MRALLAALVLTACLPCAALAQDAPSAGPAATIGQMDWLAGRWEGPGIEGLHAVESWLPAFGTTMVGTFVQADPQGGIMFSEHMYLVEEGGTLILKLKHFNPDLTGWEDAGEMLRFTLEALEPCHARFNGLTMRCQGEDGLMIAVRMRADDGSVGELVFNFRRTG
jgi:hypothetical protein